MASDSSIDTCALTFVMFKLPFAMEVSRDLEFMKALMAVDSSVKDMVRKFAASTDCQGCGPDLYPRKCF